MKKRAVKRLPEPPPEPDDAVEEPRELGTSFPIVGVGASAGGLEAFTQLLKALPADTGMAFVLVQHLAPTHPSALAEILSRATRMPVVEVQVDSPVETNHVYVIPPGQSMIISGGELRLLPREARGQHRVVDQFFRALAEDQRHRAIGVVLSGTASDGTQGLEAIKAEGGITFAQDDSAQHGGMPQSAIASGCVDFVLPPNKIAQEIVRIGHHPHTVPRPGSEERNSDPNVAQVVQLLRQSTGVDFTDYKFNTFYRRVTRRMLLQKMTGLTEYVKLLQQSPAEVDALYQDILINVTSFFRDPAAFEALKSQVISRMIEGRSRHEPVRMWALGCSTGQEAYSLAMAYTEVAETAGSSVPLQLFATDLNAMGVEKARAGVYSRDIAQDVSPERLRRFFVEVDAGYRISKAIRDTCVFSRHNVLADPPFARIDLISCRNLLIYLEPVLQQRVVSCLHYALKPTGFLWLGGSETIGTHRNLFDAADAKHRIYARKPGSRPATGHFPQQRGGASRLDSAPILSLRETPANLHKEADRVLLTKFAPPGVLVSTDLDILQYRGDTGAYLAPAPGKASLSLLKMLREGMLVGVRAAIIQARKEEAPVRQDGLRVKSDGGYREVTVEVIPIKGHGPVEGGFLVLFEEAPAFGGKQPLVDPAPRTHAIRSSAADLDKTRLEQELAATREYLESVIEQQEASNEELQSASEEIQSANEELQSTNEELETSKEEVESSNEELATVNDELNNRNLELHRANDDLVNLLGSVHLAIVMLGPDLRVRRFTPTAERVLNLISTDVGRPLADIKFNLDNLPDLQPLLREVLDTVSARELDVQDKSGRWYSLRLRPYKTLDNKIDGVIVMLVDVDAIKRAGEFTANIVTTLREPLLVLDADLRVKAASAAYCRTFQVTLDETENRFLYDLGNGHWDIPELRRLLKEVAARDTQVDDFEVEHELEDIGKRTMLVNARRLLQPGDQSPLVLLAIDDVTERRQRARELAKYAAELSELNRRKSEFLAMLAHELRNPLAPIRDALRIIHMTGGDAEIVQSASDVMERQIDHMIRMVDDLVDVSRIDRGKIELRRGRVELGSVVGQAVEAVRPLCKSMKHELTVTVPPEPIYLNADPTRLAQALGNLLNNACKFTESCGRIGVTVEREDAQAVIRVEDTGIGLAPDMLVPIFEMFTQVNTSLERTQSGLGIGLALVKTLVELHDGTVEVQSAGLGSGSEFVIRLPILEGAPAPHAEPTLGRSTITTPRRILVVDDHRDSADALAKVLNHKGHETHTAYDGLEAVEAASTLRPDVIVLDLGLPKLNGYDVIRKIRAQRWGKKVVLVALSGWGQDEVREKTTEAGFDGHLVKPVDHAALDNLLTMRR